MEMREAIWQKMYWKGADAGGDNKLDLKEVENLCLRLNISAPPTVIKKLFDVSRLPPSRNATDEGGSRKLIVSEQDFLISNLSNNSSSR